MIPAASALARATTLIPWWCAMNARTTAYFSPSGGRVHDERGHQVLEHRAGPGDERRAASDRSQRAAEMEPVRSGDVATRDRDEARQARLGGEQVVVAGIEAAIGQAIADREELA